MFLGTYIIAPGLITYLEVQTGADGGLPLQLFERSSLATGKRLACMRLLETSGGMLAQLGTDGQVVQFVDGNLVEGMCCIPVTRTIPRPEYGFG